MRKIAQIEKDIKENKSVLAAPDGLSEKEIQAIENDLNDLENELAEAKAASEKSKPASKPAAEKKPAKAKAAPKKPESKPAETKKPAAEKKPTPTPKNQSKPELVSWKKDETLDDLKELGTLHIMGAPGECEERIGIVLAEPVKVHPKGADEGVTLTARTGEVLEFVHIGDSKFRQYNIVANPKNCHILRKISSTNDWLQYVAEKADGRKSDSDESKAPFFAAFSAMKQVVPFADRLTGNEDMTVTVEDTTVRIRPTTGVYDPKSVCLEVTITKGDRSATYEVYPRLAEPLVYFMGKDLSFLTSIANSAASSDIRSAFRSLAKEVKPSLVEKKKPTEEKKEEEKPTPAKKSAATTSAETEKKPAASSTAAKSSDCATWLKSSSDKLLPFIQAAAEGFASGTTTQYITRVLRNKKTNEVVIEFKRGKNGAPHLVQICTSTGKHEKIESINEDAYESIKERTIAQLFSGSGGTPKVKSCAEVVSDFYEKCSDGGCDKKEFDAFKAKAERCKMAHNDKEHNEYMAKLAKRIQSIMAKKKISFEAAFFEVAQG